jgi:TolB-like protein
MRDFFTQLKRRNVFRVAVGYLAAAWLVLQVVNNLSGPLDLPAWVASLTTLLLAIGLPIALVLAWLFEFTPQGLQRTAADGAPDNVVVTETTRRLDYVIIGLLAVVAVLFATEQLTGRRNTPAAAASTNAGRSEPSIAVLPFADMSPNRDQEYFSDGLSEELLNQLAQLEDLRVIGRTSSFAFKGKNDDLRTIGATLGVNHILEGSVRKAGERIRITAQLIDPADGSHLWSNTYDRDLDDVFAVQDEIAMAVAEILQVSLGVGALGQMPGMTRNLAAYDEYLKAKAALSGYTIETVERAAQHLRRATELDPSFAMAWVNLYLAYAQGVITVPTKARDWRALAADALSKAEALTPQAPAVLLARAEAATTRLAAGAIYAELMAPGKSATFDSVWRPRVGLYLMEVGRTRDAMTQLERARSTDPLDAVAVFYLATAHEMSGNPTTALGEFDRSSALGSGLAPGGALLAALAMNDRAEIERRFANIEANPLAGTGVNLAMKPFLDDRAAAPAEIERRRAIALAAGDRFALAILSHWAAYYGAPELALKLFRDTGRSNQGYWYGLHRETRKLTGFKDVVRDFGLVDYWQTYGWGDFCKPMTGGDFECS